MSSSVPPEPQHMVSLHGDLVTLREQQLLGKTAGARDGQRLPTPDRLAVLELSAASTEQKHKLRRHQQLLQDIAHRAREQDIDSLSGILSKKCNLDHFGSKYEDRNNLHKFATNSSVSMVSFSHTPAQTQHSARGAPAGGEDTAAEETPEDGIVTPSKAASYCPPLMKDIGRTTTSFPLRKPKTTPRSNSPRLQNNFPKLKISYAKGLPPSHSYSKNSMKTSLIRSQNINGPIQLKHYIEPKDFLAPLVLPEINGQGRDLDSVESFVKSKQMKFADRPKTNGYEQGFSISKPALIVRMGPKKSNPPNVMGSNKMGAKKVVSNGQDCPGPWVTHSLATASVAPSSPTMMRSTGVRSTEV